MPNPLLTIRLRHNPAFTARSHGWCRLAPFFLDGDRMDWAVRLPKGGARRVTICWSGRSDGITAPSACRSEVNLFHAGRRDVDGCEVRSGLGLPKNWHPPRFLGTLFDEMAILDSFGWKVSQLWSERPSTGKRTICGAVNGADIMTDWLFAKLPEVIRSYPAMPWLTVYLGV